VGARFSAPVQTGPGAHPASYNNRYRVSFLGLNGRGVALTTHRIYRRGKRKSKAIPLLPLWVFVACSRENFTIYFNFLYTKYTLVLKRCSREYNKQ